MNVLPILDCEFTTDCPRKFLDLDETDDPKVRYCTHCNSNVYRCDSTQELAEHQNAGRCVALTFQRCTNENTQVGDVVRVTGGSFSNQEATIEKLDVETDSAVIVYHLIGRVTPESVPLSELGHVTDDDISKP